MRLNQKSSDKISSKTKRTRARETLKLSRSPFIIFSIGALVIISGLIFSSYIEISSFISTFDPSTKQLLGFIKGQ